jgi:tRNA U34 2-thiouridine synthase MnmA/TrmU
MKREHKAIALFSGGLDSVLSVLYMKSLGYEVIPVFFESPFYTAGKAKYGAKAAGFDIKIVDITKDIIEVIKAPRYGFGKYMNPCIDCHGLMFRKAAQIMEELGASFVISGEVLGQRPMSQRRDSMNAVGKLSGIKDLLIRPLCQKLIDDTKPIREGWVSKNDMLDIQGRNRKRQFALAEQLGLKHFETPGGGCLLTDKQVGEKVSDLLEHDQLDRKHLKFIKQGRRARLSDDAILIIGRTKYDNEFITKNLEDETVIKASDIPGPLGVIIGDNLTDEVIDLAGGIILSYNNKVKTDTCQVEYGKKFQLDNKKEVKVLTKESFRELLINK